MDWKSNRPLLIGIAVAVLLALGAIWFFTLRDTGPRTNLEVPQRGM